MIYLVGDTHGELEMIKLTNKFFPEAKQLTKDDYVIILGDFGLIWREDASFKYWMDFINSRPYKVLFLDGNHENFDLLNSYPVENWNGGYVHKISDNLLHLMRGQVFTIDNKKIFVFGGAESIDKLQRTEYIDWWKEELPTSKELHIGLDNLEKHEFTVDYILTHTCSKSTINELSKKFDSIYKNPNTPQQTKREIVNLKRFPLKDSDVLSNYFDTIKEITNFKHWYFGHFHIDANINEKESFVYNIKIPIL